MQVKVYQYHINDTEFAKALVDSFLEIHKKPNISIQKTKCYRARSSPSKEQGFSKNALHELQNHFLQLNQLP